jgi:gluconolactonase
MAVDCAGNLYLTTSGQVRVFSSEGMVLGNITGFAGGGTTNAAFGGDDARTLFVTAGNAVYQIKLNVPGLPN